MKSSSDRLEGKNSLEVKTNEKILKWREKKIEEQKFINYSFRQNLWKYFN